MGVIDMTGNATHSGTPCFISWVCVSSLYGLGFVLLFHGTLFLYFGICLSPGRPLSQISLQTRVSIFVFYTTFWILYGVITSVDVVSVFVFFTFASSCL